jgi:hypothetical protein
VSFISGFNYTVEKRSILERKLHCSPGRVLRRLGQDTGVGKRRSAIAVKLRGQEDSLYQTAFRKCYRKSRHATVYGKRPTTGQSESIFHTWREPRISSSTLQRNQFPAPEHKFSRPSFLMATLPTACPLIEHWKSTRRRPYCNGPFSNITPIIDRDKYRIQLLPFVHILFRRKVIGDTPKRTGTVNEYGGCHNRKYSNLAF